MHVLNDSGRSRQNLYLSCDEHGRLEGKGMAYGKGVCWTGTLVFRLFADRTLANSTRPHGSGSAVCERCGVK